VRFAIFAFLANFAKIVHVTPFGGFCFCLLRQQKMRARLAFCVFCLFFESSKLSWFNSECEQSLIIIQVLQGKALQNIVKGALLNHKNGITKMEKSILQNANYKRTPHASKLHYQSAYQGFGNDVTLKTRWSNFCPAWRS